jgi:hypothetical protein
MKCLTYWLLILFCCSVHLSISQNQQTDTTLFRKEIEQGDFKHLHEYIKLKRQTEPKTFLQQLSIKELSSKPTLTDKEIRDARYKRNIALQSLYVENSAPSNFMYARMKVRDTAANVFDAFINANFYMFPKYWPVGLVVNPKFNLRMLLDDESAPIRTPSNMVGGTLFRFVSDQYSPSGLYAFTTFSFYHHSNGQDLHSYNPDGSINIRTGNFGVNFTEFAFIFGKADSLRIRNWYTRIGFQRDYIIGERDVETGKKELENEYGIYRMNFEWSFTKKTSRKAKSALSLEESPYRISRIMLRGSVVRVPSEELRLNMEAQYYWKLPFAPHFFLTAAAGWLGHDYYNIYFNEQTAFVRAGLAATIVAGAGTKQE